jgi:hypothetical protein
MSEFLLQLTTVFNALRNQEELSNAVLDDLVTKLQTVAAPASEAQPILKLTLKLLNAELAEHAAQIGNTVERDSGPLRFSWK